MRILICNERFLFRFGVDRVLLMLGSYWKAAGHEIVMMGTRMDPQAVEKCSDRFIKIPEAPDYLHGNDYTLTFLENNWDEWFEKGNEPDIALVAGWPFYNCIKFLRNKCGAAIFHDYGAVPTEGMSEPQRITQNELRRLRKENLKYANRVVAISSFLEESQAKNDLAYTDVPTSYVHLGIDHLDLHLWDKGELNITQNDVIADIRKLKEEGCKIIFQPGRWESGNYKNSDASIEVIRKLKEHNINHKILVLADKDSLEVPDDCKDNYYGLGFIDDATMRKVMEISDAGISPTTWEGFDLPLGEMQYLNKPMFVLNIGAHPEVVANPYFLCENMDEMSDKLVKVLTEGLPYSEEKFLADCDAFRKAFTWQESADKLLNELQIALTSSILVFIDVTNACHDTANSGVMRVTRKISHFIQNKTETVFIMWDDSIGKYVFPYDAEVGLLCTYGGPDERRITLRSKEGQARMLLDDVIDSFENKRMVHLFTETVNYSIMQKATRYFHGMGVSVAAVFYDAIPILRPELVSEAVSDNHKKYMMELSKCDVVIPIEAHNGVDLEKYWADNKIEKTIVSNVELAAEMDGVERVKTKAESIDENIKILFVSTLEPRKNHIRFLKGLEIMFTNHPETENRVTLHLVGNRYAGNTEIPEFVEKFCEKHKSVSWLGVVDDETLRKEYSECTFTAYPSEIEGFGMPIIESLWLGKPCLCNKAGSIGELGGKGGCCLTDVMSEEAIAEALYKMISDKEYLLGLQHEAVEREITTWDKYVNQICDIFGDLNYDSSKRRNDLFPVSVSGKIRDYFAECTCKKEIIVSNYYPPNFIGGAEIIAHNQGKALVNENIARVIVFSLDMTDEHNPGEIITAEYDGVPVVRIAMTGKNFATDGINFYNREINEAFEEICNLVEPDIIHCHNIIGMSLGIVDIAHKHKAKVCVTLHDNWGFCYKNTMLDEKNELCSNVFGCERCMSALTEGGMNIPIGVRRAYFRRQFEKIDAYISPSQYLADTYLRAGFDFHKMNVLWNGIDVERFEKVEKVKSDKIRISVVAYFGKHKGIDTLICAVGFLKREDIEIVLAGSGEETENYKKLADEFGIGKQIRFLGKIDNNEIEKVYAETDIYCLPSIWPENQPVTITEAMACGIPVVASNLGGSKELVKDNESGFIFKAGDYKDLAEKLRILIENPELRKKFGDEGRKIMKENTYNCQVRKLNGIYDSLKDEEFSSKKIISVKGMRLPNGIDKVTDKDVLLSEWIDWEHEGKDVAAWLLLEGSLETKELKFCKDREIPVLVPISDYYKYKVMGLCVYTYKDSIEILKILSEI